MSEITHSDELVTKTDLGNFYQTILPYLGGMPEALANKFDKANLYSETEKIVGCWIDGRPLYQKVISCGGLPNATAKNIPHGITNINEIVSLEGIVQRTSNGNWVEPLPHVATAASGNTASQCTVRIETENIVLQTASNLSTAYNGYSYVVVRYTKTTDQPNSFNIGSDTDYSTTEKIVGTWIDGKPVYQKTLTNLNVPITAHHWATIITDASWVPNIKDVLYSYAICSNYKLSINPIETFISGNDLQIQSAYGDRIIKTFIIQYTKTTD